MSRQKLHFRLYEKGKWYISKHWLHRSKVQQSQFLLPAIVNPTTRFSMRDKVWLWIGVFFGIIYILSVIVSIQVEAQQAIADQRASTLATTISSSTHPGHMSRTRIPNPPPISIGKPPSSSAPTPVPAARPTLPVAFNPTATLCPGVNCNPWGYNFIPGNLIYNPPAGFCNYFACVADFNQPHHIHSGYVVKCTDGTYSQFIGRRATCILHGGILRPLYAH